MQSGKIYQILLMTFFGILGSVLVGFVFFSTSVFDPSRSNFQFVTSGLYGSLFFSLLQYKSKREQLFAVIIIPTLQLVVFTGRDISAAYIIRDVFYLSALFLSLKLYHLFLNKNMELKLFLRSLALVFFYGLINPVFAGIVYIINAKAGLPPADFLYTSASDGILIGFGIGLGIDFYLQNRKRLYNLFKITTA